MISKHFIQQLKHTKQVNYFHRQTIVKLGFDNIYN